MKKNKKYIALVVMCVLLMSPLACKKNFLTQTDSYGADQTLTFTNSQDVVAIVNSIYDTYQSSDLLKKSIWYYSNFLTHDFFNNGADIVWNYYGIGSDFGALPVFWNNAYIGINRANSALGVIQTAMANGVVTQALGQRLEGEAYFLRGMTYYYLAGTFGGVPLVLSTGTSGLQPRSTQDQCFQQVVADMQKAEGLLLSKTQLAAADLGRATKGAAYGYEGAAQMWLKNYTAALAAFNNPEIVNNYSLVPKFVNVNEFNNQNNQESLFEVQFQVYGSQSWDGGWNDGGEEAWIDDFDWPQEISGFGYDYANPGLWYSYEHGDLRKAATIVGPGDSLVSPGIIAKWGGIKGYAVTTANFTTANGTYTHSSPTNAADSAIILARKTYTSVPYVKNADSTITRGNIYTTNNAYPIINTCGTIAYPWYGTDGTPRSGYYCAKKWRDPTLTGANGSSAIFGGQNQVMLRYAEILLDKAECEIRLGQTGPAMADIQTVRNRAWGGTAPAMQSITITGTGTPGKIGGGSLVVTNVMDPMQMVLNEYRHELTADYSLMYDLRRAGAAAAFIQGAYNTTNNTNPIVYPFGPTADGKTHGVWNNSLPAGKDLLPIPQSEFVTNPNLTQNPTF